MKDRIAVIDLGTNTFHLFIAELDGEIVHEQDFVVGHDCCHVLLISGPGA